MQYKYIFSLCLLLFIFQAEPLLSETFMDFDFPDGEIENGFNGWWYSPRGDLSCPIYNAASQSKMCSAEDSAGYVRSFYYYYNGYNSDHMGWMRWGFIDSGDVAIRGKSLEVTFTGGAYANNGTTAYSGLEVRSKEQYAGYIDNDVDPHSERVLPGDLTLYFKTGGTYHPFQELVGKDRLSVWILPPEESLATLDRQQYSNSYRRPDGQFSWYPFVNHSNGDHYYHDHTNINLGGWIHLIFDAHPIHNNSGDSNPYSYYRAGGYDFPGDAVEYFTHVHGFSLRAYIGRNLPSPAILYVDEIEVYKTSEPENDETIGGIGVGYDPGDKLFDISFMDKYRCSSCTATYEVRYSFLPITNGNYTSAKLCKVMNFDRTKNNDIGVIHKPNGGYNQIWAALNVEEADKPLLTEGATIYFAVKDISDRSHLADRDTFELGTVPVTGVGDVRRVDLIKTIDYEIFPLFKELSVIDSPLPSGHTGEHYATVIDIRGGIKPFLFELESGTLPEGLLLSADGHISGVPVNVGQNSFQIKVSESSSFNQVAYRDFTINIYPPEVCTDSIDNDEDGLVDCLDPGCFDHAACSTLLVDFGSPHSFGMENWETVIHDVYTGYVGDGPGGMTNVTGNNGSYNYQGVSGSFALFKPGQRIMAYWYNSGSGPITFTPKISFTDPDRPDSGATGVWHFMSEVTIDPGKTAISEYLVDEATKGAFQLVNVNVNQTNDGFLICDKILQTSTPAISSWNIFMPAILNGGQSN